MQLQLLFALLTSLLGDIIPVLKAYVDSLIGPYKGKLDTALNVLKIVDTEFLNGTLAAKDLPSRAYQIAKSITDEDGIDEQLIMDAANLAVRLFRANVLAGKAQMTQSTEV